MKLAPPEYPADVPCTKNIHLCRNLFDKSPGLHGSIEFRSSHLINNCEEKHGLCESECDFKFGKK